MQVKLVWDNNSEDDVTGYRVYQGSSPGVYSGYILIPDLADSTPEVSITAADGALRYFAITAVDASLNESVFSDELSVINRYTRFRL